MTDSSEILADQCTAQVLKLCCVCVISGWSPGLARSLVVPVVDGVSPGQGRADQPRIAAVGNTIGAFVVHRGVVGSQ
ncbi:hypothetical protein [Mycobacterium lepromatosis]|uniref:hypothetical protein n=1 Tax=Mycobacterium lepromatosis TaxID=480418 RepID=UPI0005F786AB|nr:hypothetical protein [Mycobacterium lepromatosis]